MPKLFDWTPWLDQIRERVPKEGYGPISKEMGLDSSTIRARVKSWGLSTPTSRAREQNKGLKVDYFDTWTEESAYDLGYIQADGTVWTSSNMHMLKLKCVTEDESIILGIRSRLRSNHQISRRGSVVTSEGVVEKPETQIQITSKTLVESIILRGVIPNKSNLDPPFPEVPLSFLNHFLRGYLDGDGSVYEHVEGRVTVSFCGSLRFIHGVRENLCSLLALNYNRLRKDDSIFKIAWADQEQVKRLYEYLYPIGNYPFLPRKRDRLESLIR